MHIQYFDHTFPTGIRTLRLGMSGNIVFVYIEKEEYNEFFKFDVRFPFNWVSIGRLQRDQTNYQFPVLSPDGKYLYVLCLTWQLSFEVYRFDIHTRMVDIFRMSETHPLFQPFQMPLDEIKIRCGGDGEIVFYDRSIVQGEIPLWSLQLREEDHSFEIAKKTIGTDGDNTERNSALFPVLFDPAKRIFAKLMGPRMMLVYIEKQNSWVEYALPAEESLMDVFGTDGFPVEEVRNIRETYGRHGHRVAAMQTRLTFHDMDGAVVARMIHADRVHKTARVELDHARREIRVTKLATFKLNDNVCRMFYPITSPNFHIFLGVSTHAIVFLRSPTLEEIVGWKFQQKLLNDGYRVELQQVSNYNQVVVMILAKYGEQREEATEHLRNLGILQTPIRYDFDEFDYNYN